MATRLVEGVEIHQDTFIHCPMRKFKMRKATACGSCEHFAGILEVCQDPVPWENKYRVLCEHAIARRVELIGE